MPEYLPLKYETVEGIIDKTKCSFDKWEPHSQLQRIILKNTNPSVITFESCLPLNEGDKIKAYIDMRSYSGGGPLPVNCTYKNELGSGEKAFKIEKIKDGQIIAEFIIEGYDSELKKAV